MRRRQKTRLLPLLIVGFVFAALSAPALNASQTGGWSVVVANNAFVDHGNGDAPTAVVMGGNVAPGDRLTTGDGGALVLSRGEDLVTMAENSRIEIVDPQPTSNTLIDQPYGHVEYHVTKEKVPHFQVDAPLLATIVKGTTFSVDASDQKSSVSVSEGRVEAKNRRTGDSQSVGAGERGTVETRDRGVEVGAAPSKAASEAPAGSNPSGNSGNGNGNGNGNSGSGNNGNGNGNGNNGNGGGHGNGNNGNGNGGGNGNGNNGNGNGNGGGNGNGHGNAFARGRN
ncbi:FecR domain-containing protein [Dongia sp.]|uniref:FecR domain-containing protein n=1 Tax=Dongia sp. TaxID=1977262 RepID=UPI0037529DB3